MYGDGKTVVGRVIYPPPGHRLVTLFTDGSWEVPPEDASLGLAQYLEEFYSSSYKGPQDGPFGPQVLADLARDVGGVRWLAERGKSPEVEVEY